LFSSHDASPAPDFLKIPIPTMPKPDSPSLLSRIHPVFWVFLGVFVFQALLVTHMAGSPHFVPDSDDMRFYRDWARKISGEMRWRPGEPNYPGTAFYGLPAYAYSLSGIYSLTGGYDPDHSPLLVAYLQAAFHAGTAAFLFLLAGRIFGGADQTARRQGLVFGILAAGIWAAFTPAQVVSAIHMPTALVICSFWGVVYWIVRIHENPAVSWWRPWLWMGLLLGFMAMFVASILMLIPLVLIGITLTLRRKEGLRARILSSAAAVAVLLAGVYIGCSPCWIHNYFVAKDPVLFSAHDGVNFYIGNHSTANGYTSIPQNEGLRATQEGLLTDSITVPEKKLGRTLLRSEVSQFWKDRAQLWISMHRFAWLKLLGVKVDNFWNTFQYDDLSILRLFRIEELIPPGLRWGQIAPFALAGLLSLGRWPRLRWVAGAVFVLMFALLPAFITERYRLAAAPGLILLMMGGLAWLWEKVAARRLLPALGYLLVLGGAVWWTTLPRSDIGLWSLDFYKAGIRATDTSKRQTSPQDAARSLERAQAALERAYGYVPESPEVLFALGNLWYLRHDPAKAEPCLLAAIRLDDNHDGALANLAQLYADQRQWPDALEYLLRATTLAPENPKRWYSLSIVYKELGKKAEARDAAERARALLLAAVERDPKNFNPWFTLSQVYKELGDLSAARAAIQRARALAPQIEALIHYEKELDSK
jgi:tetratricopeptide (TPR) repeat protein